MNHNEQWKERYISVQEELARRIKEAEESWPNTIPWPRRKYYSGLIEIYEKVLDALGTGSNYMFLDIEEEKAEEDVQSCTIVSYRVEALYRSDGIHYAAKICRRLLKDLGEIE